MTQNPLAEPATDPQRRYLCRHIHTLGHRCHSPALTGAELCYHHTRARRQLPISGRSGTFSAPTLDDRASLQLALNDLYARIAGGDIDLKRAAALLHVLREASLNLARRTHPTLADLLPAPITATFSTATSANAAAAHTSAAHAQQPKPQQPTPQQPKPQQPTPQQPTPQQPMPQPPTPQQPTPQPPTPQQPMPLGTPRLQPWASPQPAQQGF